MSDAPNSTTGGIDQELDVVFKILSNSTRRHLLQKLSDQQNNSVTFDDLYQVFLATGTSVSTADDVKTALYHTHLPLLSDASILTVDWERQTVSLGDERRLDPLLQYVAAGERANDRMNAH